MYVGGIVASEASRKKFDVPNNIIKRLPEKMVGSLGEGAWPLLAPPWIRHWITVECARQYNTTAAFVLMIMINVH